MDPIILKTLHVAGAFALFSSLGAVMLGGSGKKGASILHGVSLILILLVGFAMLKKPPMDQYSGHLVGGLMISDLGVEEFQGC